MEILWASHSRLSKLTGEMCLSHGINVLINTACIMEGIQQRNLMSTVAIYSKFSCTNHVLNIAATKVKKAVKIHELQESLEKFMIVCLGEICMQM